MSDLGALALRFALPVALLGIVAGAFAGVKRRDDWTQVAERAIWIVGLFVAIAMVSLAVAFANCDFELRYVANNSSRDMALPYRLAAVWGGQAGSLLLWLFIMMIYACACVAFQGRHNRTLMPWVTVVLLANATFFLVLLTFVTEPFEKLPPSHVLSDGAGLNPLLQHPVMMIHPIMLYLGLVGFVIPFAFAFAALVTGELGSQWFRVTRRWTLIPWLFLSIGIVLGGRWAYEVLGWGGYWAWDPVENASFMPWLPATAYLHSVMIQEKRGMLRTWNLLLIGLTYTVCLFGTFLTRSGIVQSVHAFAQTPVFQTVFLSYVLLTLFIFVAALVMRRGKLKSPNRIESMLSREASFLLNNWVFIAILLAIMCGTLFPVFTEALTDQRIAVGPSFFNLIIPPLALFLLFLTGIGPLIAWRRASRTMLRRQFTAPVAMGLVVGIGSWLWVRERLGSIDIGEVYGLLTWGLSAFVITTIFQEYWRAIRARVRKGDENPFQALGTLLRKHQQRYGGYVVHLGVVCAMIGFAGSILNQERLENVKPGSEIELAEYRLRYLTADALPAQHFGGAKVRLALYRNDAPVAVMTPEKRMYWLQDQPASIPSIYSTLTEDFYVILTALERDGSATLKLYYNPLVNWIWIGIVVFVVGTAIVMWPHPSTVSHPDAT